MQKRGGEKVAVDLVRFEETARKYESPLIRYCYGRVGADRELALEVFDDVLCILYEKWDRIDTNGNIFPWLL